MQSCQSDGAAATLSHSQSSLRFWCLAQGLGIHAGTSSYQAILKRLVRLGFEPGILRLPAEVLTD